MAYKSRVSYQGKQMKFDLYDNLEFRLQKKNFIYTFLETQSNREGGVCLEARLVI